MTRDEARHFLFEIIFQMESNKDFDKDHILQYMKQKNNRTQELYLSTNLTYLCENKDEVDEIINNGSPKWKTHRMPKTDLAIMRLAVCEFNAWDEVPVAVTINEAVKLAKEYCDDNSSSFINGVLGHIANEK